MTEFPSFAEFYVAVNARDPFPWQRRLAEGVAESGWPSEIGIPTGLGKTSCIDIALWALATQAVAAPTARTAPTRVWYVVNRRLLVDQAWAHGVSLATMLRSGRDAADRDSSVIRSVAEALRSLTPIGVAEGPLQITRLRGGASLGGRSLEPSQPAIIFSTVAMYASRWLFRGYGTSTSMRPIDAALAGIDSLVLLDEAHLARPLIALSTTAAMCDVGDPATVLNEQRSRPVMVALTATGEGAEARFDLDTEDLRHPVVKERVSASKLLHLHETDEKSLDRDLAQRALELLQPEEVTSCVVFVNTPLRARAVAEAIEDLAAKRARGCEVLLATGRMRDREGEAVRGFLLDPLTGVPAGRSHGAQRGNDLIIVATQTLEVGADLDFDALVTESCGNRALIQRLGRLNRLGTKPLASGWFVHPSDRKEWPVYEDEPASVWEALAAAARDGALDLSPERVGGVLGPPQDEPRRVGELLPAHLWEWAKTSSPPPDEAPVGLFFDGFADEAPRISISWRAHLPRDGVRLFPGLREAESVDIPLSEARRDLEGIGQVRRLADDRASLETVEVSRLRPGDEVVVPASFGSYDQNGWNPAARGEVLDASAVDARVLLLSREVIENLAPGFDRDDLLRALTEEREDALTADEEKQLVSELIAHLGASGHHAWLTDEEWEGFIDGLGKVVERPVEDAAFLSAAPSRPDPVEPRADAFEELSFDATSVALAEHLGAVGETAAHIGQRLGMTETLVASLKTAGEQHDVGKRDPRFQRWLHPDPDPEHPRAKSRTPRHLIERERIAAGWPRGGRHELLSARMASEWLGSRTRGSPPLDEDLVLHLIASHHGHGRPLVPVVDDPYPATLTLALQETALRATCDLSRPDWGQPARFRSLCERYGCWGLALLEAIVRQSDQAVSSRAAV